MAERNEPGCSTNSPSDSLDSATRFTTVSSDGEDAENSGEDTSESSSRTSAMCFITVLCESVFVTCLEA